MQVLILASSSPRRKELMTFSRVPFEVITSDAEEVTQGLPDQMVMENAGRKARAVAAEHPGRFVLGADTLVWQGEKALGKPHSREQARDMLRSLSGRKHWVYTGVCLVYPDGREDTRFDVSGVDFIPLSDSDIDRYIATGEPMDKAGAYAVQGTGGLFVSGIQGSYSNVIGLPMTLVREMLLQAGLDVL